MNPKTEKGAFFALQNLKKVSFLNFSQQLDPLSQIFEFYHRNPSRGVKLSGW